jgi:hypothetical protein
MNKDTKSPLDDWEGVLSSRFEKDNQLPPDHHWSAIEHALFPKKKRRLATFWFIFLGVICIGSITMSYLKWSSTEGEKTYTQTTIKGKEGEVSKEKKAPQKVENHKTIKNPLYSNEQTAELIDLQYEEGVDDALKSNKNNFENRTKNTSKEAPYDSDINRMVHTESSRLEGENNLAQAEVDNSNGTSEDKPKITDTISRLKVLPIQLLPISLNFIVPKPLLIEEIGFRPYFSFYFSPLVGRNIRNVRGTFNSGNTSSNAIGDRRVSLPKYGFQTGGDYHVAKRLSLNSGFQYAIGDVQSRWFFKYLQIDPSTSDVRLKTSSGEARTSDPALIQSITNGTTGIYKLRINHAFSLYSIPIGITYRFTDERFTPYFRTGLNMEFFGKRTLSLDVLENGIIRTLALDLRRNNIGLTLQTMLSFGIESRLIGNWRFFTEAAYFVPINKFLNTNGFSVSMAGASILGGLRYDLK